MCIYIYIYVYHHIGSSWKCTLALAGGVVALCCLEEGASSIFEAAEVSVASVDLDRFGRSTHLIPLGFVIIVVTVIIVIMNL